MIDNSIYNHSFYKKQSEMSEKNEICRKILSIFWDSIKINSVCDVGCGLGYWLQACHRLAEERNQSIITIGYDTPNIPEEMLLINRSELMETDLYEPLTTDRRYDLVICLEVAEHLPKERSESLISELTMLGDVVLFSAAVPNQGGRGHINERWLSEWVQMFENNDFAFVDCIRPHIWDNRNIYYLYRQNIAMFVKKGTKQLEQLIKIACPPYIDIINPDLYLKHC